MRTQQHSLWLKILLLTSVFSLVTACGFQLRGAQDVSDDKRQVHLLTGNAPAILVRSLQQNMKFNGIQDTANAPYQIQILNHRYNRRAATLSRNSDIDEFELSLEVTMIINDAEGKPLSADITLQRERVYDYDKNAAAASDEQEAQLRRELYQALAQTILRRYLAFNAG